jgi:hypothetical protein
MSPHRFDFLIVGLATGTWWAQLSPVKRALAALSVVLLVGFSAGSMVSQLLIERTGALARLDRVERIAVRDSTRIDVVEAWQAKNEELARRVQAIEATLIRVDDRTQRIACLLAGNQGPACL